MKEGAEEDGDKTRERRGKGTGREREDGKVTVRRKEGS